MHCGIALPNGAKAAPRATSGKGVGPACGSWDAVVGGGRAGASPATTKWSSHAGQCGACSRVVRCHLYAVVDRVHRAHSYPTDQGCRRRAELPWPRLPPHFEDFEASGHKLSFARLLASSKLAPHSVVTVQVNVASEVSKIFTFTTRSGAEPALAVRCLDPGAKSTTVCP